MKVLYLILAVLLATVLSAPSQKETDAHEEKNPDDWMNDDADELPPIVGHEYNLGKESNNPDFPTLQVGDEGYDDNSNYGLEEEDIERDLEDGDEELQDDQANEDNEDATAAEVDEDDDDEVDEDDDDDGDKDDDDEVDEDDDDEVDEDEDDDDDGDKDDDDEGDEDEVEEEEDEEIDAEDEKEDAAAAAKTEHDYEELREEFQEYQDEDQLEGAGDREDA